MSVPQNTVMNLNNVVLIGVPLTILSLVQILPFLTSTFNEHSMVLGHVVSIICGIHVC